MSRTKTVSQRLDRTGWLVAALAAAAAVWGVVYAVNEQLWGVVLGGWIGLDLKSSLGSSLEFLLYDTVKILLLLVGMIFAIGLLRTTLNPEKVRSFLEGKSLFIALVLAATLGAVTPFCPCSSIPLFIGFVAAGVPLGVTFAFLIASPLVNEVAVIMLGQTFGWEVTVAYVAAGLALAVVAGWVFTRFDLTRWVEEFVFASPTSRLNAEGHRPTLRERVDAALEETRDIFGRVWKWVIVGVTLGAGIHGWVPTEFFASYAGQHNPFAVVLATLLGVPLYSNAAGVIPIAEALWSKGMALGTVMSFHDGNRRTVAARVHPIEARLEDATASHLLRNRGHRHHARRPRLQPGHLSPKTPTAHPVRSERQWPHAGPTERSTTMQIKILGPGCCRNCVNLEKATRAALDELGLAADVMKVTNYADIAAYGIMSTPGLVVNETVLVSGRVPKTAEIKKILAAQN